MFRNVYSFDVIIAIIVVKKEAEDGGIQGRLNSDIKSWMRLMKHIKVTILKISPITILKISSQNIFKSTLTKFSTFNQGL